MKSSFWSFKVVGREALRQLEHASRLALVPVNGDRWHFTGRNVRVRALGELELAGVMRIGHRVRPFDEDALHARWRAELQAPVGRTEDVNAPIADHLRAILEKAPPVDGHDL
jgi:hypothetical protein